MQILVINPNSTTAMTKKIATCASVVASSGTIVHALNPSGTPLSIEGNYDAAMSLQGVLEEVRKGETEGYDGFVIACFDDVGVDACREIATGPVIGICEAAMHAASMLAPSFSVVTTLARSVSHIRNLAIQYGFERKCCGVHAVNIPVLDLDKDETVRYQIRDSILRSVREDGSEAVILGCAGMTDLTGWLTEETKIPVIDGVAVAVRMVEALVGVNLKTSKINTFAKPREK